MCEIESDLEDQTEQALSKSMTKINFSNANSFTSQKFAMNFFI